MPIDLVDQAVLYRTFLVRYGGSLGTGFALNVDGRQYLVTAKHVAEGINDRDQIEIIRNDATWMLDTTAIRCENPEIDIIVLSLSDQIAAGDQPEIHAHHSITFSQDIFVLGFPFGLVPPMNLEAGQPLPFVRKGALSAIDKSEDEVIRYYIGTQTNPGFSGGPMIFRDLGRNQLCLGGVVYGGITTNDPVLNAPAESDLKIDQDAGISLAFGIKHAMDAIRANPIGFELPKRSQIAKATLGHHQHGRAQGH